MGRVFRLSKSQYGKGLKCPKALWLYRHKSDLADKVSDFQQNIFNHGKEVGALATKLFPNGIMIEEDYKHQEEALAHTKDVFTKGPEALFEAAFQYENVLVRVDILEKNNDGTWNLIEVKSTNDVEPDSHHDDVAIQKWVLVNCGVKIKNAYLMHLNREYIRNGELDLEKLFVRKNLDEEIKSNIEQIESKLEFFQAILNQNKAPEELIGSRCKNPYVCEFKGHCWDVAKAGTIHTLSRISDKKRHALMDLGIEMISQIPKDFELSANQLVEYQTAVKDDVHIELNKIQDSLEELKYPLYFLDYESVAYAIPRYSGSWPHKQLISQYSLHKVNKGGEKAEHKEFIFDLAADPNTAVATALAKDIPDDGGTVIVYHKTFERDRTLQLADSVPEFADHLRLIVDRMWDLETPFAKRWYWDPKFNGSSSIKNVLPVFAPLYSYKDLEIQKGDLAQLRYSQMIQLPNSSPERAAIRNALLKYCERDSLAMVLILKELAEIVGAKALKIAV